MAFEKLRLGGIGVLLVLAGCQKSFDDRYAEAQKKLNDQAASIDKELADKASEAALAPTDGATALPSS